MILQLNNNFFIASSWKNISNYLKNFIVNSSNDERLKFLETNATRIVA